MAFDATGLNAAGGQSKAGNAPQIWTYTTTDSAATVDTSGYFNSIASILRVGDLIYRVTTSSGSVSSAGLHVVLSISAAGVVDVADAQAVNTGTNTD